MRMKELREIAKERLRLQVRNNLCDEFTNVNEQTRIFAHLERRVAVCRMMGGYGCDKAGDGSFDFVEIYFRSYGV